MAICLAAITGFLFKDAIATEALSISRLITISIDNLFSGALSEATSANFHANWFCFFNLNLEGYTFTVNFFNFFPFN